MESNNKNRKLWLKYVMKLNDRTLAKQQSSGFTTWAILGIVVIVSYKIIDQLPVFLADHKMRLLLLTSLTNILNISYLIKLFGSVIMSKSFALSEMRLKTRLSMASEPFLVFTLYVIYALLIYMNILIVINEPYSLPLWPYILFALIFLMEILGPSISKAITFFKMRDEYSNLPVLSSLPIIANKSLKRITENVIIIIIIILFIILIKPILMFINNSNILSNINIIKCSFEISGFIFLVLFLIFRISSSFSKQFLESLERRIIMEELTAEEIKTIFIKEFVGDTV
jgi:hypothetical protein